MKKKHKQRLDELEDAVDWQRHHNRELQAIINRCEVRIGRLEQCRTDQRQQLAALDTQYRSIVARLSSLHTDMLGKCPACNATVNTHWTSCIACEAPLSQEGEKR